MLAQQGQPAESEFREAIRLQPTLGSAWNNLAVLFLQQKRETEAIAALKEGLAKAPKEELLYINLARVHMSRQDRAAARTVIEELLRQIPSSEIGRKALASLNAAPGR
jgi:Flp pilus assembly protein TadD